MRDLLTTQTGIDVAAFIQRVMRPAQPRIKEVREALTALLRGPAARGKSARERLARMRPALVDGVWESLTTRFDAEWLVGDPRRVFLPFYDLGSIQYGPVRPPRPSDTPTSRLRDAPWNLETVLGMLAADPETLVTVERAAMEAASRVRAWGVTPPTRIAWTVMDPLGAKSPVPSLFEAWVADAAWYVLNVPETSEEIRLSREFASLAEDLYLQFESARRSSKGPFRARGLATARNLMMAWFFWRSLAETEVVLQSNLDVNGRPYEFGYPPRMAGVRFADLPDVLDPLLVAWGLGYHPVDIRGDVMVIAIPAMFRPVTHASWRSVRTAQSMSLRHLLDPA